MRLIKKILERKPYKLTVQFDNGEIREVNLEKKIKSKSTSPDSKYKMLLDVKYFVKVKLHKEWETIYWDNGLDFCPDVLYDMGEQMDKKYSQKKVRNLSVSEPKVKYGKRKTVKN